MAETHACSSANLSGAATYPWRAESEAGALVNLCSPGSGDGGYLSLDRASRPPWAGWGQLCRPLRVATDG